MKQHVRRRVETAVTAFLDSSGLAQKTWNEPEFIQALRHVGYDVVADTFEPRFGIFGAVFRVDHVFVVMYPTHHDRLTRLQGLVHEGAHLILGHDLQSPSEAARGSSHAPGQEEEAEYFTRLALSWRATNLLQEAGDSAVPEEMMQFFRSVDLRTKGG